MLARKNTNTNGTPPRVPRARRSKAPGQEAGPPQPVPVEQFKDLSERELIAVANQNHEKFTGSLRRAIVEHARVAGAALLQMKGRIKKDGWRAWLKANF